METQTHSHGWLKDLENFFDTYLHKKVPFHLPTSLKEFIVAASPWITLILMVLSLPLILFVITHLGLYTAAYGYVHYYASYWISTILVVISFVLEAMALPGLFARKAKGWYMVYYAVLINSLGSLISVDIISFILGLAIGLYVLFQVREYYK